FRGLGLTPILLTGDNAVVAETVARQVGIDPGPDAENSETVIAEVLPAEKVDVIRKLQAQGRVVAMVGDGVNDAPALAEADIGIAKGLGGTDVAVETADVALASDDLERLLDVRDLGGRAVDVIRQNYAMSIAVNALGLLIGAGGALSPVLAAVLHNASSVAVVANSSRLIRYGLTESRDSTDAS
ncbi:MAG: HAD-IC family P-type ATPase, partial [Dietzia sp.]|nr:HAD-IC family P-type ATPase [Dietzia sp.]